MTGPYRQVFSTPHFTRLLVAALVGRLPIGIIALALILLVRDEGGTYTSAGLVAGAFAAGGAIGAPVQGRLMDRRGQQLLLGFAVFDVIALAALVGLIMGGGALGLQVAASLLAGAAIPPISSVMRTLWSPVFSERRELMTTAFAVDSVAIEMVFVLGPLLTALLATAFSPVAPIAAACVLLLAGTTAFVTSKPSREWRPSLHVGRHGRLGALSSRGLRTVLMTTVPVGFGFGAIEVAMPGFSEVHGGRELAGLILAVWSLGSVIGGVAYGARPQARPLVQRYILLVGALPLCFAPMLVAGSLGAMLPLALLAGIAIAPAIASANQLVGQVAPEGAVTEAYTWGITALVAGVALGNATGGALLESDGWRAAVLAGVASTVIAGVVVLSRRATLQPSPTGSEALSDPAPA